MLLACRFSTKRGSRLFVIFSIALIQMTVAGVCTYYPTCQLQSQTDASRHIEAPSTATGTALNYAALRLLGVPIDHPMVVRALATLHKLGEHDIPESYYVRLQVL